MLLLLFRGTVRSRWVSIGLKKEKSMMNSSITDGLISLLYMLTEFALLQMPNKTSPLDIRQIFGEVLKKTTDGRAGWQTEPSSDPHSDLCSVFFPQSNHIRRKSTIRSWPAICFNAGIESPSALPAERTRPSWRMSWRLSTRVTITASNSSCSPSTKEFKATETTPWRLSRGINSSTTCRSKSCLTKVKGRGCWLQAC